MKEYDVAGYWGDCPKCDSNAVTAGFPEYYGRRMGRKMKCEDCGAEWVEEYELRKVYSGGDE